MIWGIPKDTSGQQWLEVFSADLKVAEDGTTLEDWTLRFGRKGEEGRRVSLREPKTLLKELAEAGRWEWALVFKKDRP